MTKRIEKPNTVADPYVTLTYSKLGKPLYSTRIIKGDRNPVYEETAFLMVDVNTMRLKEKLSFQLWDSDRTSVVRQISGPMRPKDLTSVFRFLG